MVPPTLWLRMFTPASSVTVLPAAAYSPIPKKTLNDPAGCSNTKLPLVTVWSPWKVILLKVSSKTFTVPLSVSPFVTNTCGPRLAVPNSMSPLIVTPSSMFPELDEMTSSLAAGPPMFSVPPRIVPPASQVGAGECVKCEFEPSVVHQPMDPNFAAAPLNVLHVGARELAEEMDDRVLAEDGTGVRPAAFRTRGGFAHETITVLLAEIMPAFDQVWVLLPPKLIPRWNPPPLATIFPCVALVKVLSLN